MVDLGEQHAADCRVDRMRRARTAAIAAGVILLAAVIVAFGRTVLGSWHATGDHAVLQLRTLDVGGAHNPLVGPYSRYGWSHPGPALFYALAPTLRLFGGRDIGMLAGAVVINALALVTVFAATWRRRDTAALVFVMLIAAVLLRAHGGTALLDPWNPNVIVLPLLAAAVCAWTAAAGSRWALAGTVVFASFVAQTHIGAAPAALALVLFAFAWVGYDTWRARGDDRRRRLTTIAIAIGVGFVAWLPPMVQAVTTDGGNLRDIWDFWSASNPVTGFAQGARLVSPQFAIPAPWMGAPEHTALGGALVPSANRFPVALVLLAVVTLLAARRRDRRALTLCTLAIALAVATWIAASRVVGIPYPYLLRWAWVAGAVTWLAILWTAWRSIPKPHHRTRNTATAVVAAAACVVALFVVVSAARASYPVQLESVALDHVRGPALDAMRHAPGPILLDNGVSLRSAGIATGLLLEATRAGLPAKVPASLAYRVGTERTLHGQPGTVIYVASDTEVAPLLRDPSYRLLARYESLSAADRRELARLLAFVDQRIEKLVELKRDHRSDYDRLLDLEARGANVAVFIRR
jgi:hypothetical protein